MPVTTSSQAINFPIINYSCVAMALLNGDHVTHPIIDQADQLLLFYKTCLITVTQNHVPLLLPIPPPSNNNRGGMEAQLCFLGPIDRARDDPSPSIDDHDMNTTGLLLFLLSPAPGQGGWMHCIPSVSPHQCTIGAFPLINSAIDGHSLIMIDCHHLQCIHSFIHSSITARSSKNGDWICPPLLPSVYLFKGFIFFQNLLFFYFSFYRLPIYCLFVG